MFLTAYVLCSLRLFRLKTKDYSGLKLKDEQVKQKSCKTEITENSR